jgi:hypothetical protein
MVVGRNDQAIYDASAAMEHVNECLQAQPNSREKLTNSVGWGDFRRTVRLLSKEGTIRRVLKFGFKGLRRFTE